MSLASQERRALDRGKDVVRAASSAASELAAMSLRIGAVTVRRLRRRSDYQRWTDPTSLQAWWDSRTQLLAEMIPPGSRVIEFGAGRRQLERYLHASCTYVPSDLVDRGTGTLVWDLNRRPLPDLKGHRMDVAAFGGVLEYIVDVPALVEWLVRSVSCCVMSYSCVTPAARFPQAVLDRARRIRNGYVNHLSEAELVWLFGRHAWSCMDRRSWREQRLLLFRDTSGRR